MVCVNGIVIYIYIYAVYKSSYSVHVFHFPLYQSGKFFNQGSAVFGTKLTQSLKAHL